MIGFIKLHRQLLDWEWYDDIPVRLTFFHLLLKANWEEKRWKGITIKRGQILTGTDKTPKEIGITTQQFRTAIKKLKSTGEITSKSTNKSTLVTIVKYDNYQTSENKTTSKTTNKITNEQQTNNKRITTTKEDNNIINKEIKKREVEKKSLSPLEIIKSDLAYWQQFQMNNKKQINDWEKMLLDWECKVDEEGLKYDFKILKARLERYSRNWQQNQNRYKSKKEDKKAFSMNR